jgi:hypothetical protein
VNEIKRELQRALQNSSHPTLLLASISVVAAWAITTSLKAIFAS